MVPIPADNPPTAETIALDAACITIRCFRATIQSRARRAIRRRRDSPTKLAVARRRRQERDAALATVINSAYTNCNSGWARGIARRARQRAIANPVEMRRRTPPWSRGCRRSEVCGAVQAGLGTDKITIDLVVKVDCLVRATVLLRWLGF